MNVFFAQALKQIIVPTYENVLEKQNISEVMPLRAN